MQSETIKGVFKVESNIHYFDNPQFGTVRAVEINDELWCVLSDVCRVLGLPSVENIAESLGADKKIVDTIDDVQEVIVSESGLCDVIYRPDKPNAGPFMRWLVYDAIPNFYKGKASSCTTAQIAEAAELGILPVQHGDWKTQRNGLFTVCECSVCGKRMADMEYHGYPFCPHCGAEMLGKDEVDKLDTKPVETINLPSGKSVTNESVQEAAKLRILPVRHSNLDVHIHWLFSTSTCSHCGGKAVDVGKCSYKFCPLCCAAVDHIEVTEDNDQLPIP